MNDLTLGFLAEQVEALASVIATRGSDQTREDWRKVLGMFRFGSARGASRRTCSIRGTKSECKYQHYFTQFRFWILPHLAVRARRFARG
jgi:hypothetical protein